MKTRKALAILVLLAGSCTTRNETSALVISSVIPPIASAVGTGATSALGCKFDPASPEYTPDLPYNPAENRGSIAAVVVNNLSPTVNLNPLLRGDSTSFLPHQAVVNYEYVPAGAGAAPGTNTIPTAGIVVPGGGGKGTVGIDIFNGLAISVPNGTYIRVTFHLEGKLVDGSLVHTAEREYLFRYCTTVGCGLGGPWAVQVGTTFQSCL